MIIGHQERKRRWMLAGKVRRGERETWRTWGVRHLTCGVVLASVCVNVLEHWRIPPSVWSISGRDLELDLRLYFLFYTVLTIVV